MEFLQSVLSLIVTLGILVTIHEYGHFWVARRCGVRVLRFSVGFGKPLYSWYDKHGTEFAIAAIPLGGYVKMLDEREAPVDEADKPFAFTQKPVGQRIAIASAGPIANFLFAIIAYWLMFILGFNVLAPKIGAIEPESPAAEAGLQPGQEIVAVEGRETPGWRAVTMELVNRIGDSGTIAFEAKDHVDAESRRYNLHVTEWLKDSEQKDLVKSLGLSPYKPSVPAVIGQVLEDGPAHAGGLVSGDTISRVDGQKINDWFEFVDVVKAAPGKKLAVEVLRAKGDAGEVRLTLSLIPESRAGEDGEVYGRLGVGAQAFSYPPELIREVRYGPVSAFAYALDQTWSDTVMTLNAIKKMIVGLVSLDNLSGPITIAQVASQSISSGKEEFLRFLALLSISLGILNLLPIPVLDGGHILYYTLEAIRGKPLSEKFQLVGLKIGISFILLLMTIAFYNDVMRLQ